MVDNLQYILNAMVEAKKKEISAVEILP